MKSALNLDLELECLIPHRDTMLLLEKAQLVEADRSVSLVTINPHSSFYINGKGVPTYIGIEYMGQTAALTAGFQLLSGAIEPHIGLLLGSRGFSTTEGFFESGSVLHVVCQQRSTVQGTLANFDCKIYREQSSCNFPSIDVLISGHANNQQPVAEAALTVYRQPLT